MPNRQHWICKVQDSVNGYREVQSTYFDGDQHDAIEYFREAPVMAQYFGSPRYQIVMQANSVILQTTE